MGTGKKGNSFHYAGIFFKADDWEHILEQTPGQRLECVVAHPHITIAYRPETIDPLLLGKQVQVQITGYGRSETNEAFRVRAAADDPALQQLLDAITVPHITISVSRDGEKVDSRYLDFSSIDQAPMLTGVYGVILEDDTLILMSEQNFR